jgi:ribosomal protein S27AE
MGFVVIRDFLRVLDGEKVTPREFCDKCGFIMLFHPDPFLKLIETTQPASP